MIPQIIVFALIVMNCGAPMNRLVQSDPKPTRKEVIDAWSAILARLVWLALLYWGGFFDVILHPR